MTLTTWIRCHGIALIVITAIAAGCASLSPTQVSHEDLGRLKGQWIGTRYTTVKGSTQRYELPTMLEITGDSLPLAGVWSFYQTTMGTRTFSDSFDVRDGKLVGRAVLVLHSDGSTSELRGDMELAEYHEYFVLRKK